MQKYIVMCCRDGNLDTPGVHDSYDDAYEDMEYNYNLVLGWNPDLNPNQHEIDDKGDYANGCAVGAWVEDVDHQTYWGISEIVV